MAKMLALTSVGKSVRVIEAVCTFPESIVVEIGDHRPMVVIGQCRQRLNEQCYLCRGFT